MKRNLLNFMKAGLVCFAMVAAMNTASAQDTEVQEEQQTEEGDKKKDKNKDKDKEKKEDNKLQKGDKKTEIIKYRRSSLHTMIIEDTKLPKSDLILSTFNESPVPDKFNDHTVGDKSFKLESYYVEPVVPEGEKAKKKDEKDLSPTIDKYLKENKVANQIIAKWFNRDENGAFDMNLIQERGAYDASAQDAAAAASTQRGLDMLKDAGIELLSSTFVVVSNSKFESNEPYAAAARDIAKATAEKLPAALKDAAFKTADAVYEKAKEGYSVWTTAYLYQLVWTDSVEAYFWNDYWMDANSINPDKKAAFDNTDFFSLKLLGYQKASALVSGLGANAEDEQMIIKNATLKSINSVYNKLERKFEPFRTKTPLVSVDPLGAKIGMKEELEGGDKYEVLMPEYDAEGKLKYKRKAVIKVDKKSIWDNRFNAGEGQEQELDENGNPIAPENQLEFTHFKGSSKGLFPGMLIRQIN
ncbi:MAG: hypothetical protein KDD41_08565 [Flavobacteriales bacterium]|nr:hypothetical protein [Flavobacteriales bacterium]